MAFMQKNEQYYVNKYPNNKLVSSDMGNNFKIPNLESLKTLANKVTEKRINYNYNIEKVVAEDVADFVRQAKTFTAVHA